VVDHNVLDELIISGAELIDYEQLPVLTKDAAASWLSTLHFGECAQTRAPQGSWYTYTHGSAHLSHYIKILFIPRALNLQPPRPCPPAGSSTPRTRLSSGYVCEHRWWL